VTSGYHFLTPDKGIIGRTQCSILTQRYKNIVVLAEASWLLNVLKPNANSSRANRFTMLIESLQDKSSHIILAINHRGCVKLNSQ
jgi:hypothetical protein